MKTTTAIVLLAMLQMIACKPPDKATKTVRLYMLISKNSDQPRDCTFITGSDEPTHIQKGKTAIDWCFTNITDVGRIQSVTIDGFVDKNDPQKKNPFGKNSDRDNTFKIELIEFKQTMCTGTKVATKEGYYYYRISAVFERADGSQQLLSIEKALIIEP